jgi:DNA repair protein RadA/Sms
LVAGSVTLIGGDPGIGKSTLLLQLADRLARVGHTVLYVSGEESIHQIRLRADRLGVRNDAVWLLAETSVDRVIEAVKRHAPHTLIADSVQTLRSEALESSAGSVGQVRDVAGRLMVLAKQTGTATFLVGHVTKDGAIAGPRVLEHIVDTVLYFEGEKGHPYRILRTVKNRFGSTQEVGVFEMKGYGLAEVANPSELFLAERSHGSSGSVIIASAEGTRPILVEMQALVTYPVSGTPRRTANGIEAGRLGLLLAVLEKRVGLGVGAQDVFVNVAGGLCLEEPAADLGIAASVVSSWTDRPIDPRTIVFGEIGLAGEIRAVPQAESRLREAAALGFTRCVLPKRSAERVTDPPLEIVGVENVHEALEALGVR